MPTILSTFASGSPLPSSGTVAPGAALDGALADMDRNNGYAGIGADP